jgi:hypothetical protein
MIHVLQQDMGIKIPGQRSLSEGEGNAERRVAQSAVTDYLHEL